MRRLLPVVTVLLLAACTPAPPPIVPNPPPVQWINQCEVPPLNPGGYTRPIPTNHPITTLSGASSTYTGRWVVWINRVCDRYYIGALDYAYAPSFCAYRPDLGDRYIGDWQAGTSALWIGDVPRGCAG